MGSWKVFAEDEGTGLVNQSYRDWGDAANFNALAHSSNTSDYAVSLPTVTYDSSVPEITLGKGQYRITVENISTRDHDGPVTWPEVTFAVISPESTISLNDDSENKIWIDVDLTTDSDDAQFVVSDTEPNEPSILVATVDTSTDSVSLENKNPDTVHDTVSFTDTDGNVSRQILYDTELEELVVVRC